MGDDWEHAVIIEKLMAPLIDATYPQFLGGERRCPPEDCCGVPGYYEFLKNLGEFEPELQQKYRWNLSLFLSRSYAVKFSSKLCLLFSLPSESFW
jgi:hypothetical protein